jgi:hypothetical protein
MSAMLVWSHFPSFRRLALPPSSASETSETDSILTRLIVTEDFIAFSRRESFSSYTYKCVIRVVEFQMLRLTGHVEIRNAYISRYDHGGKKPLGIWRKQNVNMWIRFRCLRLDHDKTAVTNLPSIFRSCYDHIRVTNTDPNRSLFVWQKPSSYSCGDIKILQ